jgi:hypothetical protein
MQRDVFQAILALKRFGLIRTNRNYLREAPKYYKNNWKCDHSRDPFVHVGIGGTIDVCSEVRTPLRVHEIESLDSTEWRELKRELVSKCSNCLHQCHFETQNTDVVGDALTGGLMALTMLGAHGVVRWAGSLAARSVVRGLPRPDWELSLPHRLLRRLSLDQASSRRIMPLETSPSARD